MSKLNELMQQRAALDRLIDEAVAERKREGVEKIKAVLAEYGMTAKDLAASHVGKRRHTQRRTTGRLYRDPATGKTWGGWGPEPKWLKEAVARGLSRDHFLAIQGVDIDAVHQRAA